MNVDSKSMCFIFLKFSDIDVTSTMPESSISMSLIAFPYSFINGSTFPFINTISMSFNYFLFNKLGRVHWSLSNRYQRRSIRNSIQRLFHVLSHGLDYLTFDPSSYLALEFRPIWLEHMIFYNKTLMDILKLGLYLIYWLVKCILPINSFWERDAQNFLFPIKDFLIVDLLFILSSIILASHYTFLWLDVIWIYKAEIIFYLILYWRNINWRMWLICISILGLFHTKFTSSLLFIIQVVQELLILIRR